MEKRSLLVPGRVGVSLWGGALEAGLSTLQGKTRGAQSREEKKTVRETRTISKEKSSGRKSWGRLSTSASQGVVAGARVGGAVGQKTGVRRFWEKERTQGV